jgi:hypothetical protein
MTLPVGYSRLIYRGHFECEVGISYKSAKLGASLGGGYKTVENIFPPLLFGSLSYPTLHRDAMIETEPDVFVDRLDYIWSFYRDSKDNADKPFLMKSPLDGKWYLFDFPDDDLSIRLVDLYMGTTGLKIEQRYIAGVVPDNADGSFDEE